MIDRQFPCLLVFSVVRAAIVQNIDVKQGVYTVKKVHEFPVSSRDVTNQTPPGQE